MIEFPAKGLQLEVELTNHCNFNCKLCPQSHYQQDRTPGGNRFARPKGFMSDEVFSHVLRNAASYARGITLGFFGEQMMHPKLFQFLPALKDYGKLVVHSNWSLATVDIMSMMQSCVDVVQISIDASEASIWEELCPGGPVNDLGGRPTEDRYGTLVDKIKYWLNRKHHPRTRLVYVVSSTNEHDWPKFVREWRPLLGPEDDIMVKSAISYSGVVKDPYMTPHVCDVPDRFNMNIAWDGRCTPCNLDVDIGLYVGNIRGDLREIVESDHYEQVIAAMRERDSGVCKNCFDANHRSDTRFFRRQS